MPLVHEYNAAQRRAYYLRTRKLKGRKKGSTVSVAARRAAAKAAKIRKRKALQAKIEALQARLEKLRKILAVLVDKAQARNGNGAKDATPEKQTAKQKAAAKKASEKYAKSAKGKQTLSAQAKELSEKVKSIEERIKKLRAKN